MNQVEELRDAGKDGDRTRLQRLEERRLDGARIEDRLELACCQVVDLLCREVDALALGEKCADCDCDLYLVVSEDETLLVVECDCASSVVAA